MSFNIKKRMSKTNLLKSLLFTLGLFLVLTIQGAIPFATVPTLGQALWTAGFGQSFINESIFNIYARNFGCPEPAAIAFGLAGAWPVGILIKLGLHPIDAYSTMAAGWIALGFLCAYWIGRHFSLSPNLALLSAVTWGSMPIIWVNAGYSMASIGMILLSFYFLAALKLFTPLKDNDLLTTKDLLWPSLLYFITCLVAVFMDGYTFVMFAVGSSLIAAGLFFKNSSLRKWLLKGPTPVHFLCFIISYYLYIKYIGKSEFPGGNLDNFRSSGNDLSFFLIPTKGVHWIADTLGLSTFRSESMFFGGPPVWMSAFCAPILIGGIWALYKLRNEKKYALGLIFCMLFGIYMSLGPSLKINSRRPPDVHRGDMPAKYAIAATGSGLLSKNLPGFKNMRVSHRWLALGVFGCWALTTLIVSDKQRNPRIIGICILSGASLFNLPNIPKKLKSEVSFRHQAFALDSEFIEDLEGIVTQGESVAFLPYGNDFLINYAASRIKINTYNIGGDKNLAEAQRHWPASMRQLPMGWAEGDFSLRLIQVLARKDASLVIIPYIDLLWAAHGWPAPLKLKDTADRVLEELRKYPVLEIESHDYFASARLVQGWDSIDTEKILGEIDAPLISLPLYSSEWHGIERNSEGYWKWSRSTAQIEIYNFSNSAVGVEIDFSLASLNRRALTVLNTDGEILWEDKKLKNKKSVKLSPIRLNPGSNILSFKTGQKPSRAPNDNRELAFRLNNFSVKEIDQSHSPNSAE